MHCEQIVLFGPPLRWKNGTELWERKEVRRPFLVRLLRMVPEWDLNCHASRTIMQEERKEEHRRELQLCLPAAKQ